MKTRVLFIALLFIGILSAKAANPVTISAGSAAALKNCGEVVCVFDYSNATIKGKPLMEYLESRGEDFVRDWPTDTETINMSFMTFFNMKNKLGIQMVSASETAKYKFVLTYSEMDLGNGGSSLAPFSNAKAGGFIMSGTANFIDISTGETVLSFAIDELKGLGGFTETSRRTTTHFDLTKKMFKLMK